MAQWYRICLQCRRCSSIPGWRGSSEKGYGNSLQYSCLANPTDRGTWWATVRGIAKSRTGLKQLNTTDKEMGSGELNKPY